MRAQTEQEALATSQWIGYIYHMSPYPHGGTVDVQNLEKSRCRRVGVAEGVKLG